METEPKTGAAIANDRQIQLTLVLSPSSSLLSYTRGTQTEVGEADSQCHLQDWLYIGRQELETFEK